MEDIDDYLPKKREKKTFKKRRNSGVQDAFLLWVIFFLTFSYLHLRSVCDPWPKMSLTHLFLVSAFCKRFFKDPPEE